MINSIVDKIFLQHPRENNMTYIEHMCFSCSIGVYFLLGSCQAFCHGCIPYMFEKSSSEISECVYKSISSSSNACRNQYK